ncbi:hypothetical protein [Deinococcus budaensis]|uniref:Uncharacterized protein n=1 Tax=Deinococcus budaensis TaxID=1665626 RepID=A0A7W8GBZ9_9DEIO|nr:hypothetical protein [Deinococcus budaensis]MBB5232708.1 hypothetical protein [Deinococcus budaensis]
MRLEALLAALGELFGPRLSLREAGGEERGVVLLWDGEVDCTAGLAEGGLESVAWQLLSTAQDVWLQRLGEEGVHPGAWATASPDVSRDGVGLVLSLRGTEGVVASVRVPLTG